MARASGRQVAPAECAPYCGGGRRMPRGCARVSGRGPRHQRLRPTGARPSARRRSALSSPPRPTEPGPRAAGTSLHVRGAGAHTPTAAPRKALCPPLALTGAFAPAPGRRFGSVVPLCVSCEKKRATLRNKSNVIRAGDRFDVFAPKLGRVTTGFGQNWPIRFLAGRGSQESKLTKKMTCMNRVALTTTINFDSPSCQNLFKTKLGLRYPSFNRLLI